MQAYPAYDFDKMLDTEPEIINILVKGSNKLQKRIKDEFDNDKKGAPSREIRTEEDRIKHNQMVASRLRESIEY